MVLTGGEFWCFKRERLVHEALNISCWFLIWDLPITHSKARGLFWGVAWPQDFVVSSGNRLRDLAMAEE